MDDQQPQAISNGRDSRRVAAAWLRGHVTRFGIRPVARQLHLSTEAIARYLANLPVQRCTAESLERRSYQLRQCREAHQAELASAPDADPAGTEEGSA
jgi:hypothetical protein